VLSGRLTIQLYGLQRRGAKIVPTGLPVFQPIMKRSGNLLVQKSDGDVRNLSSARHGRPIGGDRAVPVALAF